MISSAGMRFAFNDGGFRITAPHVGMGFRAGRFSGLRHASKRRAILFFYRTDRRQRSFGRLPRWYGRRALIRKLATLWLWAAMGVAELHAHGQILIFSR
jgi:hypothetical protein